MHENNYLSSISACGLADLGEFFFGRVRCPWPWHLRLRTGENLGILDRFAQSPRTTILSGIVRWQRLSEEYLGVPKCFDCLGLSKSKSGFGLNRLDRRKEKKQKNMASQHSWGLRWCRWAVAWDQSFSRTSLPPSLWHFLRHLPLALIGKSGNVLSLLGGSACTFTSLADLLTQQNPTESSESYFAIPVSQDDRFKAFDADFYDFDLACLAVGHRRGRTLKRSHRNRGRAAWQLGSLAVAANLHTLPPIAEEEDPEERVKRRSCNLLPVCRDWN
jgi:hypothetical protein